MKCPACGYESLDGVKFCSKCGLKFATARTFEDENQPQVQFIMPDQDQSATPNLNLQQNRYQTVQPMISNDLLSEKEIKSNKKSHKKPSKKVIFLGGGIVAAVLIITIAIIILTGSDSSFETISKNFMTGTSINIEGDESVYYFTYGGKVIETNQRYPNMDYNFGQTVSVYMSENQELNLVTVNGSFLVAEAVTGFQLSNDGTGIAYITDIDGFSTLYLYNTKTKKTTKLDSEVTNNNLCISPDGDTVGYNKMDAETLVTKGYLSVNGEEAELLGKSIIPIAVSNDATYLYYLDESKLYVRTEDDLQKLSSMFGGSIMINQSYSQILFNDDGKSYISINGGEKQKLMNQVVYGIIAVDTLVQRYCYTYVPTLVVGVDSFLEKLLDFDHSGYFLKKDLETVPVYPDMGDYDQVSQDGTSIIYSDYGDLYRISDISAEAGNEEPIAKNIDITSFAATSDLSCVYYTNSYDELMCIKDNNKPKKIADEVAEGYYYMDTYDDTLYFLSDVAEEFGTLYYSYDGKAKKKIKGAEDVRIRPISGRIYYEVENEEGTYDLYLLNDGSATCVLKGIQ